MYICMYNIPNTQCLRYLMFNGLKHDKFEVIDVEVIEVIRLRGVSLHHNYRIIIN